MSDKTNAYTIIEVNDDETISGSLGINEKRTEELYHLVKRAFLSSKTVIEAGKIISAECRHPNELFYASFALGQCSQRTRCPTSSSSDS